MKRARPIKYMCVTMETGPAVAEWCGGRWHPEGLGEKVRGAIVHWPCVVMPRECTGLPVAYAETDEYDGDRVAQGLAGEWYVIRPGVWALGYDDIGITPASADIVPH